MKKMLLLFAVLLCTMFVGKVNAEVLDYYNQEDIFKVKNGDYVCDLDYYFYGLYAYNYVGDDIQYVGRHGYQHYYLVEGEELTTVYDPEWDELGIDYSTSECFKVDKQEIYGDALGGVPDTNEFLIYKEDYYNGKSSILPYYDPEVTITCDKSLLKYGETSECTMTYVANYRLSFVKGAGYHDYYEELDDLDSFAPACITTATFNFNNQNFTVKSYDSDYEIEFKDNKFDLEKEDATCIVGEPNELLKFVITPSSEEVAGVKLNVVADDFIMVDSLGTTADTPKTFMDVEGEAAGDKENPKTSSNSTIYIVTAVCCLSLVLLVLALKKTTFKKIS